MTKKQMEKINDILNIFSPVTLKEMDSVKLMDRTDTKFTFNIRSLASVLEHASPYYHCLEFERGRISRYQTLYYDTEGLTLYLKHHNGQLNRYKVRHRSYVDTNAAFLEVKFKNNKGRTIKERIIEKNTAEPFNEKAYIFLQNELPFSPGVLKPAVWVNYGRITLASKQNAEKVTIDLNLEFKKEDSSVQLNNLVIAEVKQSKKKNSAFIDIMKKLHIREGSISKYCYAIAFMYPGVKQNNFKEKIISLKHIAK